MHRKIFRGISIESFISIPSFFTHFGAFSNFRIWLPGSMKIQKSLCLHVWSLRIRSNDGMVMKLFSAQRYDPKQVSQSLVWCVEPHKIFSRHSKSNSWVLKTQFLGHLRDFPSESGCQRVWKSKNSYVCTFGRLRCVLSMVWSPN